MEQLNKQVSVFESIKTLCSNYKKDSITRKTVDYLNLRLSTLEKLWVEFHETHETLVQIETPRRIYARVRISNLNC